MKQELLAESGSRYVPAYMHDTSENAAFNSITAIKQTDLHLTDVDLVKQYNGEWILKGKVANNSDFDLTSLAFLVTIQDCPERQSCKTIGQEQAATVDSTPLRATALKAPTRKRIGCYRRQALQSSPIARLRTEEAADLPPGKLYARNGTLTHDDGAASANLSRYQICRPEPTSPGFSERIMWPIKGRQCEFDLRTARKGNVEDLVQVFFSKFLTITGIFA